MMGIEDNTPPPPPKYIENARESGDGRTPCFACGRWHGSENAQRKCLENEIATLRERIKNLHREREESIARLRREIRGKMALEANPGGVIVAVAKGDQK
jgi:hypothetical protein